jgi:hypothetical protein
VHSSFNKYTTTPPILLSPYLLFRPSPIETTCTADFSVAQYAAHAAINCLRFSNKSLRKYAASVASFVTWADAASHTSHGKAVCSSRQSRHVGRNP